MQSYAYLWYIKDCYIQLYQCQLWLYIISYPHIFKRIVFLKWKLRSMALAVPTSTPSLERKNALPSWPLPVIEWPGVWSMRHLPVCWWTWGTAGLFVVQQKWWLRSKPVAKSELKTPSWCNFPKSHQHCVWLTADFHRFPILSLIIVPNSGLPSARRLKRCWRCEDPTREPPPMLWRDVSLQAGCRHRPWYDTGTIGTIGWGTCRYLAVAKPQCP